MYHELLAEVFEEFHATESGRADASLVSLFRSLVPAVPTHISSEDLSEERSAGNSMQALDEEGQLVSEAISHMTKESLAAFIQPRCRFNSPSISRAGLTTLYLLERKKLLALLQWPQQPQSPHPQQLHTTDKEEKKKEKEGEKEEEGEGGCDTRQHRIGTDMLLELISSPLITSDEEVRTGVKSYLHHLVDGILRVYHEDQASTDPPPPFFEAGQKAKWDDVMHCCRLIVALLYHGYHNDEALVRTISSQEAVALPPIISSILPWVSLLDFCGSAYFYFFRRFEHAFAQARWLLMEPHLMLILKVQIIFSFLIVFYLLTCL